MNKMNLQRRLVAWKTLTSWKSIPHVAYNYTPDVTKFINVFNELDITLNTLLLKAIANALKKAPDMNATCSYDLEKMDGEIVLLDHVDIDVPWVLPGGGMLSLTVKDVDKKSLKEVAETVKCLKQKVQNTDIEFFYKALVASFADNIKLPDNSLQITDIASGTITVSNVGPIIHSRGCVTLLDVIEPQVCAIGISAVQEEERKKILPMCITIDHRALDLGQIVPFLEYLDSVFENPDVIKNW